MQSFENSHLKMCMSVNSNPIQNISPTYKNSILSQIHFPNNVCLLFFILTLEGPTPTNISKNSDPDTVMKGTLASPAVALARRVFPVPGGPVKMAPFGIFAPNSKYWLGFFRKLTNSMISILASSHPATSLKTK